MPVTEFEGLKWEITYGDHDEIGPHHEQELTPLVLDLLPAGGVFLDVGAHVGHYTLRAALNKASVVYAVEPNPATAERLRENIALNKLTNVHVLELAAWDGVTPMVLMKIHEQYVRDGSNYVVPADRGPVWGARLDDALNQYPLRPERLDLVKVDVEGSDLHAISGMRGLIMKHQPVLFVEDHSEYGYYDQADLLTLIRGLDYGYEKVTWGNATYWRCSPARAASALPESASSRSA